MARLANLPKDVLDTAFKKASEMEATHEASDDAKAIQRTKRVLSALFDTNRPLYSVVNELSHAIHQPIASSPANS